MIQCVYDVNAYNRYGSPSIYFYHYPECGSRSTDSLADFLKDYSGILVTDVHQVYHSLEKRNPENSQRLATGYMLVDLFDNRELYSFTTFRR